jgi:hypothetical protein
LAGSGVVEANRRGIWSDRTGSVQLVVRSGSQAHALPLGITYFSIAEGEFNAASQIAFRAALEGPGVDSANNQGIWAERGGDFALIVREGQQVPGVLSGVNFGFLNDPVLNDAGRVAFVADFAGAGVDSTNNSSLWRENSGGLEMIARRGSQATGVASGMNFNVFNTPAFNAAGQVAFFATLAGSDANNSNNQGIWATNRAGVLQLIAHSGDLLEVAPGDLRVVSQLQFAGRTGNGDGRASGLNAAGQVAFRAVFADGSSGAFVSSAVAVPEPDALILTSLSVLLTRRSPRRAPRG